ncbi:MAG: class I tRNA ligase family protein, partial [Methanomassiliicoccales archaeon]
DKDYWKPNVQTFTRNWLEAGLNDRPITRDMSWGVSVPLPGWDNKVIYVWFEAVIGYLSASIEWSERIGLPERWKDFWTDPEAKHYYFLGKDNIPFHTIIWPAILMGYGGLNLPYDVPANEYLTFKGEKLSKSRGVSIDIPSMLLRFDPDAIRYYLASNMPENRDTEFSWDDFEAKINNELVATLGNYYHRVLSFTHRHFGIVPPCIGIEDEMKRVSQAVSRTVEEFDQYLSSCQFKRALKSVMDLAQFGNRFFDSVAPWSLLKENRERCGSVLHLNLEIVKALAIMSYPFLPRSSAEVWKFLGYDEDITSRGWSWISTPLLVGQQLREPYPLFSKVEIAEDSSMFKDFEKLDLRVGEIVGISDHPNADKLYILDVEVGKRIRLVAGLKGHYPKDKLIGKQIVVVTNLQPAKLRGVESQGMLLAAEHGGKVVLLTPHEKVPAGTKVNSGMSPSGKMLSFSEFQELKLIVGEVMDLNAVDIGKRINLDAKSAKLKKGTKVAVFLPSEDSSHALPLFTESGVQITVDEDICKGALIR